jgi:tellurite methyltransferase
MIFPVNDEQKDAGKRWDQRYRETPGRWANPDPFLLRAFSEYILPLFSGGGSAVDLAGGAGRHAIWLARQSGERTLWEVTLIDISETGVELAKQNAGPLASRVRFVVDDLTHFKASQTRFDVVMVFFYLERSIFPEIVKALRPGGLLIYKTLTSAQVKPAGGPKNPAYLLRPGELLQLTTGLRILHYQEAIAEQATAELVARKEEIPNQSTNDAA